MTRADIHTEVLASLLINPLPTAVRMRLLLDEAFREQLGIKPQFWYPLRNNLSVAAGDLHDALRAAIGGQKTATITLKDGRRERVKLGRQRSGKATFVLKKEGYAFTNADLLSAERRTRLKGLRRIFQGQPLSGPEESKWHTLATARALSDREYDDLMTTLGETPEGLTAELRKPQDLSADNMMPDTRAYFDRLVAPLGDASNMQEFIRGELATAQASLIERSRSRALRRIAFSGLWQPLIPFELLSTFTAAEVGKLLAAEDPFSLIFGFELCRASLARDAAFIDLGASFLNKLFGDPVAAERRFKIFAACALIATIGVRSAAKASSAPVFWARLGSLAHAGVLADALCAMPDAPGFLGWATRNFYAIYVWHGVVDRRESPRWKPEWISPDHVFAELVGRARGALYMLAEDDRPESWTVAIEATTERLAADGQMLASVFPGPLDDFNASQTVSVLGDAVGEIEEQLDQAERLADVKGLAALAYAGVPSEQATASIVRILDVTTNVQVSDIESEVSYLRLAAHTALAAHSRPLAQVVIERCFSLIRDDEALKRITDIFAAICEACAVHGVGKEYRETLALNAARISFVIDKAESLSELDSIFEVLSKRDEKLTPYLAKARAVVRTKLGRA